VSRSAGDKIIYYYHLDRPRGNSRDHFSLILIISKKKTLKFRLKWNFDQNLIFAQTFTKNEIISKVEILFILYN